MVYATTKFWSHAFQLIKRKFLIDYDTPQQRVKAERWASKHVVSNEEALAKLGINGNMRNLSDSIINKVRNLLINQHLKWVVQGI